MSDLLNAMAVAGTLATFYGIFLAVRKSYAKRLDFFVDDIIQVVHSIEPTELLVLIGNTTARSSVYLLRGYLKNTGGGDISPESIEEPVAVTLPEAARWLHAKVVGTSPKVRAKVEILNERSLAFSTGLMKRDEWIQIEAYAEVDTGLTKPFSAILAWTHRVEGIGTIESRRGPAPILWRGTKGAAIIAAIFCSIWVLGFVLKPKGLVAYSCPSIGKGSKFEVISVAIDDKTMSVRDRGTRKLATISEEDFFSCQPVVLSIERRTWRDLIETIVLPIGIALSVVFSEVMENLRFWLRMRRARK